MYFLKNNTFVHFAPPIFMRAGLCGELLPEIFWRSLTMHISHHRNIFLIAQVFFEKTYDVFLYSHPARGTPP